MTKNAKRKLNLLNSIKIAIGVIGVSTYFSEHEHIGFWILASGGILDGIINYYTRDIELTKDK